MVLPLILAGAFAAATSCSNGDEPKTKPLSPELTRVLQEVASLRELPAPTGVEAAAIERDDVRDLIADSLTDADREQFDHLTTLYRLLGHIGQNESYEDLYLDFAEAAVIGFYLPTEERLFVVGDSLNLDGVSQQVRSTVAHELLHAVQGGAGDVPSALERSADDLDWSMALSTVIEGDAVFHERLWALMQPASGNSSTTFAGSASTPASVERAFRFSYEAGLAWVAAVQPRRGNEALNGILRGRRITTAEILHPELYEANWQPTEVALPDIARTLGDGWKRTGGGSFGEFQLTNWLQLHLTGLPAVQAAAGWAGDDFDIYEKGSERACVIAVEFSSPEELAQFDSAAKAWFADATASDAPIAILEDGRTALLRTAGGTRATLVFATSGELALRVGAAVAAQ